MTQEKLFVLLATLSCAGGFFAAITALRQGVERTRRRNLLFMGLAFVFLCVFLALRGQQIRQCPLTNVPEMLIFVSWGLLGIYFVVGASFRWSLLGLFTYPMVLSLLVVSLIQPDPVLPPTSGHEFWNEMHKAVSVLSYGAFALACVAGVMFLVQERQLKQRSFRGMLRGLPPLMNLGKVIRRLIVLGLLLLTFGIISAFLMPRATVAHALMPVYVVWGGYAAILLYARLRGISARREAWAAVLAFLLPLITLWIIQH
jgi:ABC-type uncharacterized transport system permease subunit